MIFFLLLLGVLYVGASYVLGQNGKFYWSWPLMFLPAKDKLQDGDKPEDSQ